MPSTRTEYRSSRLLLNNVTQRLCSRYRKASPSSSLRGYSRASAFPSHLNPSLSISTFLFSFIRFAITPSSPTNRAISISSCPILPMMYHFHTRSPKITDYSESIKSQKINTPNYKLLKIVTFLQSTFFRPIDR